MTAKLQSAILGIFLFLPNLFFDLDDPVGIPQVILSLSYTSYMSLTMTIVIITITKNTNTMIPNQYQEKPIVVSAYDFIVVGAGSSGFVIPNI